MNNDLYYDLSLAPSDFWNQVRSDGGDIRVTAQDGTTQLAREVSGFDYAGHKGSLFIGMGAATSCYIYYGNPSATEPAAGSAYGKYAVYTNAIQYIDHNDTGGENASLTISVSGSAVYTISFWANWVSGAPPFFGVSQDGGSIDWLVGYGSYLDPYYGAVTNVDAGITGWQLVQRTFTTRPGVTGIKISNECFAGMGVKGGSTLNYLMHAALTLGSNPGLGNNFVGWTGNPIMATNYDPAGDSYFASMYLNYYTPATFWTTGAEVQGANPAWNYLQGS